MHVANSRPTAMPAWGWWAAYIMAAIWAQDMSGGLDFLTPAVLICLQTGQWWAAVLFTLCWTMVQEGVGNLVFGSSVVFFTGMHVLFFLARWLLEPENPFFILFYSLLLAVWLRLVLAGATAFQEIPIELGNPWQWIGAQWAAYAIFWSLALLAYQRWGSHGRV